MAMAEPPLPASQVPVTTPAQFPAPAAAPAAAVSPLQAVLLMVGSVAVFAALDALVKDLGTRYPTMPVMFFRSLFSFVPLMLLILHRGSTTPLRIPTLPVPLPPHRV